MGLVKYPRNAKWGSCYSINHHIKRHLSYATCVCASQTHMDTHNHWQAAASWNHRAKRAMTNRRALLLEGVFHCKYHPVSAVLLRDQAWFSSLSLSASPGQWISQQYKRADGQLRTQLNSFLIHETQRGLKRHHKKHTGTDVDQDINTHCVCNTCFLSPPHQQLQSQFPKLPRRQNKAQATSTPSY